MKRNRKPAIEAFMDKVSPEPNSGCWLWAASITEFGHGVFRFEGAHRFSYRAHKGEIAKGLVVRHRCDNPSCVNPDHLELGTQRDNAHDMISRGRAAPLSEAWIANSVRNTRI